MVWGAVLFIWGWERS